MAQSVPVRIPLPKTSQAAPRSGLAENSPPSGTGSSEQTEEPKQRKDVASGDVNSLLAATAIPRRKKAKSRPSQRLPGGNYVADFSKLILDDVQTEEGSLSGSMGNPQFDGLFGNLNELGEHSAPASEDATGSLMSLRSLSSESMPSLDDDSTATSFADITSPSHFAGQLTPERRLRQFSSSQDCADDHPLLHFEHFEPSESSLPEVPVVSTARASPARPSLLHSRTSTFRSNLTASLRAIKNAAQTVTSIAANPIYPPEDFLYRSDFSFAPELTDDKRPPPSTEQPSPALRRYLNPPPVSPVLPSEFHAWHEPLSSSKVPTPKKKDSSKDETTPTTPVAIPLQTCIPSAVRSPNASSPPIWLTADGTPTNSRTAESLSLGSSLARQREPRENSDYLRILVAEMNMKRNGKFSEEAESHATIWLPPRKLGENSAVGRRDRWTAFNGT